MQTKTPTPGPMKLPKLRVCELIPGQCSIRAIVKDYLSADQAAECIRRVELHDELVDALDLMLESHTAHHKPLTPNQMVDLRAKAIFKARAVLNKSQGADK